MSGWNLRYDNDKNLIIKEDAIEYYSNIKIRGYGEYPQTKEFFEWIGKPNEYIYYVAYYYNPKNSKYHGKVPQRALTEDLNNDGISDLIYWLLF